LDETWFFVFFGGACSGATMVVLSGASAGAASTTFDDSPAAGNAVAAEADALAGGEMSKLTAAAGATVVWAAAGAAVFGDTAAGDAVVGAAAFAASGWIDGVAREDALVSTLSLGAVAATEAGGDAGFAGAVTVAGTAVRTGAAGATDGTAPVRTLVTIARAATGLLSGSLGRSIRESTTAGQVVAPIAVATKTTRAVRAKLGAGAK
jgi:hypothetical protein